MAASDLLVTRVSANVLEDSQIGFIFTDGDPTSNLDNTVAGADFQYINNNLPNGRRLFSNVFFPQSDTPGLEGDDASYGIGVGFPSSIGFRSRVGYKVVEENFDPAMGFVANAGIASPASPSTAVAAPASASVATSASAAVGISGGCVGLAAESSWESATAVVRLSAIVLRLGSFEGTMRSRGTVTTESVLTSRAF